MWGGDFFYSQLTACLLLLNSLFLKFWGVNYTVSLCESLCSSYLRFSVLPGSWCLFPSRVRKFHPFSVLFWHLYNAIIGTLDIVLKYPEFLKIFFLFLFSLGHLQHPVFQIANSFSCITSLAVYSSYFSFFPISFIVFLGSGIFYYFVEILMVFIHSSPSSVSIFTTTALNPFCIGCLSLFHSVLYQRIWFILPLGTQSSVSSSSLTLCLCLYIR